MEPRGLYRERNGWGNQHSVRVKYDERQELDLAEDRYRARGYQPPFDKLPWKDEGTEEQQYRKVNESQVAASMVHGRIAGFEYVQQPPARIRPTGADGGT